MQAHFETVPHNDSCAYCTGHRPVTPLPEPLDAIYCISLQEQPHRTRQAASHFHDTGLCRHVTLYRPVRGKNGARAIWESHRALARHALAKGCKSALVLEDDVFFRQPWAKLAPRIAHALAALPSDWWALYLGHFPLQAYFVRPNILRVRSGCAHAYIAGPRLLTWLVETKPCAAEVAVCRLGNAIDGAMANLPGMYAMFPMAVLQRFLGDYRVSTQSDQYGRPRSWYDAERWRYYFIFRCVRLAEAVAVILSPFHRGTLERFRKRSGAATMQAARLIRAAGLFDEGYYLQSRPDVAAQEIDPLWHYLRNGAAEGAWPCPLFDPHYYAAQSPDLGRENPLIHFIRVGTAMGRRPHPLFDTAFYLSRYAANIPQGMNALGHFLAIGGTAGFDPHPLFDSAWYLSQHPELGKCRQNPLIHYLTEGWRQGAAPHPQFDGNVYLRWNPDVKAAGLNPLDHFARHGQSEGRAQPVRPN
jgi:GR25 family glycosyltransferase involved in LPS biosynthesis